MRGTHSFTVRQPTWQVNVGRGTLSYAGKRGQSKLLPFFVGCTTRNSEGPPARLWRKPCCPRQSDANDPEST